MKKIFVLPVLLLLFAAYGHAATEAEALPEGVKAKNIRNISVKWLQKLDEGCYIRCYDESSFLMTAALTPGRWFDNINAYRKPLGGLKKRTEINMYYAQEMPGRPKGEYIVLQYGAVFEKNKVKIESVVIVKEPGGKWKVADYFIK